MTILLIVLLCVIGIFTYVINEKDVSYPAFISCVVFIVSTVFFALNESKWEISLHGYTVFIIISALLAFCIGGSLHLKIGKTSTTYQDIIYAFPRKVTALLFAYNCIAMLFVIRKFQNIAAKYSSSVFTMMNVRNALSSGNISWGVGISILRESCYAISYMFAFVFINNKLHKAKGNVWLIFPILPSVIIMILSTGRTDFIRFFAFCFTLFLVLHSGHQKIRLGRFIAIGLTAFALLIFAFYQIGKLTGKSQVFNPFDTISIYIGSSIGGLDKYLVEPYSFSSVWGGETLYGLRRFARLFISDFVIPPIPLPFCKMGMGENTNVYTAFRRYINDYGVIGLYIIQLFKGMMFCNWYRSLRKKGTRNTFSLLLYSYFVYDIYLQSIEENLLRELFTVASLFDVCFFLLLSRIILKRTAVKV